MLKDNKKKIILSVAIFLFVFALIGGTYAFLRVSINANNDNYSIASRCFNIIYDYTNEDGTMDITGTLLPSVDYKGGLSGKVSVSIDPSCGVEAHGNILLSLDSQSSLFAQTVKAHCENSKTLTTLTDYTSSYTCRNYGTWVTDGSALKYAVFEEKSNEMVSVGYVNSADKAIKLHNFKYSTEPVDYKIYIWLDGNLSDNSYASLSLNGDIYLDATQKPNSIPEEPVLDPGMIPVTIANDGTVTTISRDDSNWYDYWDLEWANVVLVNSDSRSTYLNTTGVTVNQDDILAYYVWIPRYKYEIWTNDATTTTKPQTINIVFEDKDAEVSNGKVVGEYMTHPAFIWDGETIPGFWVGKFETSTEKTSTCYTSASTNNCNNTDQSPRIVPNVSSLSYQYTENIFKTSLKFANGTMSDTDGKVTFIVDANNIYGLNTTSNTTNSHMMKNSEWGAVAYLSHSLYGINDEIRLNNNSARITGCGASITNGSSACQIKYGEFTSYPQSTTGNITGIFDMSGGTRERVMGNYGNTTNTYFSTLPESKYYDVYSSSQFTGSSSTNTKLCTLETCGGHALYETKGWYSDSASFVYSYSPWFSRGGGYSDGISAGVFYYGFGTGSAVNDSWRSVLMVENEN